MTSILLCHSKTECLRHLRPRTRKVFFDIVVKLFVKLHLFFLFVDPAISCWQLHRESILNLLDAHKQHDLVPILCASKVKPQDKVPKCIVAVAQIGKLHWLPNRSVFPVNLDTVDRAYWATKVAPQTLDKLRSEVVALVSEFTKPFPLLASEYRQFFKLVYGMLH
ncbi:MAG: hypothetical protein U0586_08710 [Candidatus Brocadiaceae bacterium]